MGNSWLDPHPWPPLPRLGLGLGVQLVFCLRREVGTPSCLVVSLFAEGVSGEDRNFWTLLRSATFPQTNRPSEAGAVKINLCLLASRVCSVKRPRLAPLFSFFQMSFCRYTTPVGVCGTGEDPMSSCLISLALKSGFGEDFVPSISSRPQISTLSKTLNRLYKCDFRSPAPIPARFLEIL